MSPAPLLRPRLSRGPFPEEQGRWTPPPSGALAEFGARPSELQANVGHPAPAGEQDGKLGGFLRRYNHAVPAKNIIRHQKVSKAKLARAKELRRNMTPAQAVLWREVRGNRLGVHFRRQQIISGFIVDFYCHEAGLVIELDGGVQKSADQAQADQLRDEALKKLGLRVIRLQNEDVMGDARSAVERIRSLLGAGG